ncbi:hypothetical protein GH714_009279 [Hevea brasiliensis]|uniref:DUF7950 domain-containing protein n=1 Tax=Hevea brasiliensis TaxID=3981 RepID=A0A6A6LYA7_HEVBR|nr:hypothetical protein GH714_009279 [Hevea brasiliensis]
MLRFRPIAPKPATDGWKPENKNGLVTSVRTKRKYVRVKKTNEYYKRRKRKSSDLERAGREDDSNEKLFTLQLLPEKTDLKKNSPLVKGSSSGVDRTDRKDQVQEHTDPSVLFESRTQKQSRVGERSIQKDGVVRPENTDGPYSSVEEIITVRLVMKEKILPYLYYPTFTCWVRLQYTWPKEKFSQMFPCDVWKMESGGFAWRLDVKAALSLGL